MVRLAAEQKHEEARGELRKQAYLGWMIYLLTPTGKKHKKMSLKKWFNDFGLGENGSQKEQYSAENIAEMKKKSLDIASKIVEMDKKSRRK